MLQLYNHTPFEAQRGIKVDKHGGQIWVVVIKATYVLEESGETRLADQQEPVCLVPEYYGEPGRSSLKREEELVEAHPGTDVVVNGSAHAPGGRRTPSVDVAVEVAGLRKLLTVFGNRVWRPAGVAPRASSPEPFTTLRIVYERAYGGTLPGRPPVGDARNPIGVGFATDKAQLENRPLPNVEDHRSRIESWKDRPPPAGLGAVAGSWSPRRELAGTFDAGWKRTQAPLWPEDFNPVFHRSAAPGLWSEQPLKGGEKMTTVGLTPSGTLRFRLPREALVVETRLRGERIQHHPPQLDRVIVDLDDRKVVMVWSTRMPCGNRARQIEFTTVDRKRKL